MRAIDHLMARMHSLVQAGVTTGIASGVVVAADDALVRERLAACATCPAVLRAVMNRSAACPALVADRCTAMPCKCFADQKARLKHSKCPRDKWN